MEVVRIKKHNRTVAVSKNLRGILDYARKEPVVKVTMMKSTSGAMVKFEFYDGAHSFTSWKSSTVAHGWIMSRRSWGKPITIKELGGGLVAYDYLGREG